MHKRIYDPDVYNMHYHDLSVAIYQYAEFQITNPNNADYAKGKMREAINICRQEHIDWYPSAESYRGKSQKHKDKIYICVKMPNGQHYGFMHYKNNANKIMELLDDLWKRYVHCDEI